MGFLTWLEETAYAQWILTSAVGWPLMLSLHALGLAIVVGTVFALNLRMHGFFRGLPYSALHNLMGIGWIGIYLNIFTGLSVFLTRPVGYMGSNPFRVKILFIILGIVVLVQTRKLLLREAAGAFECNHACDRGAVLLDRCRGQRPPDRLYRLRLIITPDSIDAAVPRLELGVVAI